MSENFTHCSMFFCCEDILITRRCRDIKWRNTPGRWWENTIRYVRL